MRDTIILKAALAFAISGQAAAQCGADHDHASAKEEGTIEYGGVCLVAPGPGAEFPEKYLEYRRNHPDYFRIGGGLTNRVEAAKAEREWAQQNSVDMGSLGPGFGAVTGTVEVPVIPIQYTPAIGTPPSSAQLDTILFSGGSGTATDYYDEVSYGLLDLTGTVFPYAIVPSPDTFYEGGNNGLPPGGKVGTLIQHALNASDGGIDFGLYDNDGPDGLPNSGDDDGIVDLVTFLHPEPGGECSTPNIWAHRWNYKNWSNAGGSPYTTNDPRNGGGFIEVDDYTIQSALNCSSGPMEIGTFCHEVGHIFGLPDLYDTDGNSQGLGYWSLMAAGNWNSQSQPAHMTAWEKSVLGWLTPTLLTDPNPTSPTSIDQVETNPEAYQVVVGNGEYFLIENRQAVGFDVNLKTCGLAVYHVDEATILARTQSNSVNQFQNCGAFVQQAQAHYGIALEQADGFCQLESNTNRGDAGDLFPGSSGSTVFDSISTPNSNSYDDATSVSMSGISVCGATMTATIDALPLPPQTGAGLDVLVLIDNSGSYGDDYPVIAAQTPDIVAKLGANFTDIRFGLAIFRDFPFFPFGDSTDFAYQIRQPMGTAAAYLAAVTDLTTNQPPGGGSDFPESQYEAVFQSLLGLGRDLDGDTIAGNSLGEVAPTSMGWAPGRHRVIYLLTDADFHDSDTENYPGTALESIGRNAVRSLIATNFPPSNLTLFTMVAGQASAFVTQGNNGSIFNPPDSTLYTQADELAVLTRGGVFAIGSDSAGLEEMIDLSILVMQNSDIEPDDYVPNDDCLDALPLDGCGLFPFDNEFATLDGLADSLCNKFGTPQIDHDLWYSWTAPSSGLITVSTCGQTSVDTKLAVYDGVDCPASSALDCNDDTCGLQSEVSWNAVAGSTYLIRLGTFPGATGGAGMFEISGCVDGATPYCDPGEANSVSASGAVLLDLDGFNTSAATFRISDLPSNQPGILYAGPNVIDLPFGCGRRCVGGSTIRGPVVFSTTGTIDTSFDMGPASLQNIQFWYRDPANLTSCGDAFNLSNALMP